MSRLMGEMHGLRLPPKVSDPNFLAELERSGLYSVDQLQRFNYKAENFKKFKGVQVINSHLEDVHKRIASLLTEAGLSAEMPPAQIVDIEFSDEAASFIPAEVYVEGRMHPDFVINQEPKMKMNNIISAMSNTAKLRNDLLCDLVEWFDSVEATIGTRVAALFDKTMKKSDKDEARSYGEFRRAIKCMTDACLKLRQIGESIFVTGSQTDLIKPSRLAPKANKRLSDGIRKASYACDIVQDDSRVDLMKNLFLSFDLSGEFGEEGDEDQQKLLTEISKNWKDLAKEIRDILISVHELKILSRPTKLSLRRAMYLFKLLISLLGLRIDETETKDSELVRLRAELTIFEAKMDYVHKESKAWKEKLNFMQTKLNKVLKDNEELDSRIRNLDRLVSTKDARIAELQSRLTDLQNMQNKRDISSASEDERQAERQAEQAKMRKLKEAIKKHLSRIEELDSQLKSISRNAGELADREKVLILEAKENKRIYEETLADIKSQLDSAEKRADEQEALAMTKANEVERKEREVATLNAELKGKQKIMRDMIETSNRNSLEVPKKSGRHLPKRRSSSSRAGRVGSNRSFIRRSSSHEAAGEQEPAISPAPSDMLEVKEIDSSGFSIPLVTVEEYQSDEKLDEGETLEDSESEIEPTQDVGVDLAPGAKTPKKKKETTGTSKRQQKSVSSAEYKRVVSLLKKMEEEKRALQEELEDTNLELENKEFKQEEELNELAKQSKMELIMEVSKHQTETAKVYKEALVIEQLFNKFKMDLANLFDRGLMQAASKMVKSAYMVCAPISPPNYVTSIEGAMKRLEEAFQVLYNGITIALESAQESQKEVKKLAEQEAGQQTAHHMKVLGEKVKMIESLTADVEMAKAELQKSKAKHQLAVHQNEEMEEYFRETLYKKNRAISLLEKEEEQLKLQKQIADAQVRGEDRRRSNFQEMTENSIRQANKQAAKLKRKLNELQDLYDKEHALRLRVEKAFVSKENQHFVEYKATEAAVKQLKPTDERIASSAGEPLPSAPKKSEVIVSDILATETTKGRKKAMITRYVITMERLCKISPNLIMTSEDPSLFDKVRDTAANWRQVAFIRFVTIVKKYYKMKRFQMFQRFLSNRIMETRDQIEGINVSSDSVVDASPKEVSPEKAAVKEEVIKNLQTCYWRNAYNMKRMLERKQKDLAWLATTARRQVLKIFQKLAKLLLDLHQSGALNGEIHPNLASEISNEGGPLILMEAINSALTTSHKDQAKMRSLASELSFQMAEAAKQDITVEGTPGGMKVMSKRNILANEQPQTSELNLKDLQSVVSKMECEFGINFNENFPSSVQIPGSYPPIARKSLTPQMQLQLVGHHARKTSLVEPGRQAKIIRRDFSEISPPYPPKPSLVNTTAVQTSTNVSSENVSAKGSKKFSETFPEQIHERLSGQISKNLSERFSDKAVEEFSETLLGKPALTLDEASSHSLPESARRRQAVDYRPVRALLVSTMDDDIAGDEDQFEEKAQREVSKILKSALEKRPWTSNVKPSVFSRQILSRKHSIRYPTTQKMSVNVRPHSVLSHQVHMDEPEDKRCNRRSAAVSAWRSSVSTPLHHPHLVETLPELPHVVEIDVRQDLRKVRKTLQNNMRKYSILTGKEISEVSDEATAPEYVPERNSAIKSEDRRTTVKFLGLDGQRSSMQMNTEELIAKIHNNQMTTFSAQGTSKYDDILQKHRPSTAHPFVNSIDIPLVTPRAPLNSPNNSFSPRSRESSKQSTPRRILNFEKHLKNSKEKQPFINRLSSRTSSPVSNFSTARNSSQEELHQNPTVSRSKSWL